MEIKHFPGPKGAVVCSLLFRAKFAQFCQLFQVCFFFHRLIIKNVMPPYLSVVSISAFLQRSAQKEITSKTD